MNRRSLLIRTLGLASVLGGAWWARDNLLWPTPDLTFDHVIPRAQGGRTTWENVATACAPCNLKKGGRTPKQARMPLHLEPIRPTSWQLQDHGRSFPPGFLHESWRDYLYWDVELEA